MKKDRKKRKEIIKKLEQLEDINRSGVEVKAGSIVGALCPQIAHKIWASGRNENTCAEMLEEVKSLVDIKDYITCPRSKEKKAIHIGDRVFKVDGDGEPLIVEEIIVRHGGTLVQCRHASHSNRDPVERATTRLSFFPRELTFEYPTIHSRLIELSQKLDIAYQTLYEQVKKEGFSLDAFLYQL